ncbi:hypothetical protein MTO96_000476 [Rhipicephalus appendiculatus]
MHYLSTWDSVTSETVSRCFGKCGFRRQLASEDTERSEDDPCASDIDDDINEEFLSTGADAPCAEFVSIDDNVLTCEPQSVAEIVAEVVGGDAAEEVGDEAPENSPPFELLQKWLEGISLHLIVDSPLPKELMSDIVNYQGAVVTSADSTPESMTPPECGRPSLRTISEQSLDSPRSSLELV